MKLPLRELQCSECIPEYGLFTGIKILNIQILASKSEKLGKTIPNSNYWMNNTQKRGVKTYSPIVVSADFFLGFFPSSFHTLFLSLTCCYSQTAHWCAYLTFLKPSNPAFECLTTKASSTMPNPNSTLEFHYISYKGRWHDSLEYCSLCCNVS